MLSAGVTAQLKSKFLPVHTPPLDLKISTSLIVPHFPKRLDLASGCGFKIFPSPAAAASPIPFRLLPRRDAARPAAAPRRVDIPSPSAAQRSHAACSRHHAMWLPQLLPLVLKPLSEPIMCCPRRFDRVALPCRCCCVHRRPVLRLHVTCSCPEPTTCLSSLATC